ncbi:MAG TPA: hypothetical protein VFK85_02745 [Anaeromyxobacteraceae bacterium]|nr:hypothetical protein [Anaeromyxobacteraceae bacterium]
MPQGALLLAFALDDLRRAFATASTPGVDPRHDTAPFRAFRDALLDAAARRAVAPATLSFWWEGTFNGYALTISVEPPDAVPALDEELAATCPVESMRVATPRETRYALARVAPRRAEVARDAEGSAFEAPFGVATGHFGAPGVRRLR